MTMTQPGRTAKKTTRRDFLRAIGATVLGTVGTGIYATSIEPGFLRVSQVPLPIRGLAPHWQGKRVVQLSDLHAGPRVSDRHLRNAIGRTLAQRPDMVVVTGDIIDHTLDRADFVAELLNRIVNSNVPVIASLGNHDYGPSFRNPTMAEDITRILRTAGVTVLRNEAIAPGRGGLTIVGLDDLWSGRLSAGILDTLPHHPTIVLSHNPDTCRDLLSKRWDVMLSGHTHGGQVHIPFYGPLILPIHDKQFAAGLYRPDPASPHRLLYVNRGIGNVIKIRFNCRPEITVFTLAAAA